MAKNKYMKFCQEQVDQIRERRRKGESRFGDTKLLKDFLSILKSKKKVKPVDWL